MYILSRQWGWQPSEFWEATICEWWLEYEFNRPKDKGDYAGNLTRGDVDELSGWLAEKAKEDGLNASKDLC